eukprot:CAMPEP_0172657684 /NCGR_PEP_ID=MMETSP1074-20121228/2251_1 /TAXON_ID=2916 /ORGANISM="Ceratium fusus, Strain PA161109" /LENGTH=357 /DNA_ID=CAMNT_0013472813 /DNA_START=104 /DNA_END=1177 /DNA_ORIENTATION=+
MASRTDEGQGLLVTAQKCCKLAGELSYLAPDQLFAEPLSQGTFSEHICVQGSPSSNSWSSDCKTSKIYEFDGFRINAPPSAEMVNVTIKPTTAETEAEGKCLYKGRCRERDSWGAVVDASWRDRAENLRCKEDSILRPQQSKDCKKRTGPTVAILADYDGCWDIISATNSMADATEFNQKGFTKSYEDVALDLRTKIKNIASDRSESRVILFVGSDRQSYEDDMVKAAARKNGRALGADNAFESWVMEFGDPYGECWELNTVLLSDNNQPCSSWKEERTSPKKAQEPEHQVKTKLLQNAIKQLLLEDHVELYFFDDNAAILEHLRLNARIPSNMELTTIHHDWFTFAGGHSIVGNDW